MPIELPSDGVTVKITVFEDASYVQSVLRTPLTVTVIVSSIGTSDKGNATWDSDSLARVSIVVLQSDAHIDIKVPLRSFTTS